MKSYLIAVMIGLMFMEGTATGGEKKMKTEVATLGGGCFWCLEAIYKRVNGVVHVTSGYAGGEKKNPTYEQVCTGNTGHAEVVQIEYDPTVISYEELLDIFFQIHDPTTLNRQGADVGTQYRSIILYHNEGQKEAAQKSIAFLNENKIFEKPIITQLVPFEVFYPAEEYHQNYFERNPQQRYCQLVIAPKLSKFKKQFTDYLKD